MKRIYLDYAAATPMSPEVLTAMRPFFSDNFYNPSAGYLAARAARQALNEQRLSVAQSLGARPGEIIFTAGATEANNLALSGLMRRYPEGEVLVSAVEHGSVLAPARQYNCRLIPVDKQGIINLAKLEKMISPKTKLISVQLVNNELGVIQPLKEIKKILNKSSILLHTDAAQAAKYLDLHASRLGADLMSLNGGKIYGPKQSGCLYVKAGIRLKPLIAGGGQEFGLRSGTENLAAAAGFAEALTQAAASRRAEAKRLTDLRNQFERQLLNKIPGCHINGPANSRAPHITSLTIEGADAERLMFELDERGIECAVGSACGASSDEPSHVLKAIGLNDNQARATLRFSLGRPTTAAQLDKVVTELSDLTVNNR